MKLEDFFETIEDLAKMIVQQQSKEEQQCKSPSQEPCEEECRNNDCHDACRYYAECDGGECENCCCEEELEVLPYKLCEVGPNLVAIIDAPGVRKEHVEATLTGEVVELNIKNSREFMQKDTIALLEDYAPNLDGVYCFGFNEEHVDLKNLCVAVEHGQIFITIPFKDEEDEKPTKSRKLKVS